MEHHSALVHIPLCMSNMWCLPWCPFSNYVKYMNYSGPLQMVIKNSVNN